MSDFYKQALPSVMASADGILEITPNDDADLTSLPKGIYIGGTGDLAVIMPDGSTGVFVQMLGGGTYPIRPARILQTGTTATGIVGLI
ncbi:MAG: hypothetical protein AAFU82_04105 [Pseudomonadota bacterium]